MKNLFLIVGKSGSGKDYLCGILDGKDHFQVKSYTTRPVRKEDPKDETSHTFITMDEFSKFKKEDMVAYTKYNGNHYFVTKEMLRNQDLYIIDPTGIRYILDKYINKELVARIIGIDKVYVIYINKNPFTRLYNMIFRRKDSIKSALTRIIYDYKEFKGFKNEMNGFEKVCDYVAKSVPDACNYIEKITYGDDD